MENLAPLLVVAFMVISAVGRLLGKTRPAPPPTRRPRPTAAPPRPPPEGEGTGAGPRPAPAREEHAPSADVLIPDDLWAILTGERRPPVAVPPVPESAQAPAPTGAASRGEVARQLEVKEAEALAAEARERELSALVRRPSDQPAVFEEEGEARHEAFHRRLEATTPSAALQVDTGRRPLSAKQRQLRRGIILREVLGPPRGLEDRG